LFASSSLRCLLGLSKADRVLAEIVNGVPLSEERITKNCERSGRLWDIHSEEAGNAGTLDLENVVVCADAEVITTESEGRIW